MDIEDLDYDHSSDEGENLNGLEEAKTKTKKAKKNKGDDSDEEEVDASDSDSDVERIDKMADEIDEYYKQRKDYKMELDRKLAKKEKKRKALIEQ